MLGRRAAAVLGCALLSSCAESQYTSVTWQLDLVLDQPGRVATARVCSNRVQNREFVVTDPHFVLAGIPLDGEVELTVDLYNEAGELFASSGRLSLDSQLVSADVLDCSVDLCSEGCVSEPPQNGPLDGSLAVRFVERI